MKKTFKIIMLPTERESKIFNDIENNSKLCYYAIDQKQSHNLGGKHLYILSDEEIKEGDYALHKSDKYRNEYPKENHIVLCNKSNCISIQEHWRKIIATTDKSLGLPLIPDSFLTPFVKSYNEGKKITEVDLEMEEKFITAQSKYKNNISEPYLVNKGWIIKTSPDNTVIILDNKTYTKEQMIEFAMGVADYDQHSQPRKTMEEHFNDFIK